MRIQIYPNDELEKKIAADATKFGVGTSSVVMEILNKHYGLIPPSKLSDIQLRTAVFGELEAYVHDPKNAGTEFDLNMASDTYRKIEKVNAGKPSAVKAQLGKEFNRKVGKRPFASVEQIFINGKPKLTVSNRAAMYLIREVENS